MNRIFQEISLFFQELSKPEAEQFVKFLGPLQEDSRDEFILTIPQANYIFFALHNKYQHIPNVKMIVLIQDWADMMGYWGVKYETEIATDEIKRLIDWLACLQSKDFDSDTLTPAQLLCCAQALQLFLQKHVDKGERIYLINI